MKTDLYWSITVTEHHGYYHWSARLLDPSSGRGWITHPRVSVTGSMPTLGAEHPTKALLAVLERLTTTL